MTRKQDYDKNYVNISVDIDINQTIYNNCETNAQSCIGCDNRDMTAVDNAKYITRNDIIYLKLMIAREST